MFCCYVVFSILWICGKKVPMMWNLVVIRGENKAIKWSIGEIFDVRLFRTGRVVTVDDCQEINTKAVSTVSSSVHAQPFQDKTSKWRKREQRQKPGHQNLQITACPSAHTWCSNRLVQGHLASQTLSFENSQGT